MIELYEWWHFVLAFICSITVTMALTFGAGYFFFLGMKLAGY